MNAGTAMRIRRGLVALFAAAGVLCLGVSQASAQNRPSRALFGGGYGDAEQSLNLSASFGTGYDGNVLLGAIAQPTPTQTAQKVASVVDTMSTSLSYSLAKSRASLSASGGGSTTYYQDLTKPWYPTGGASTSASLALTSRTRLSFSESLQSQPLSLLPSLGVVVPLSPFLAQKAFISKIDTALLNEGAGPVDLTPTTSTSATSTAGDAGALGENHTIWNTTLALSHQLTRRVSLSLNGGNQRSTSASHEYDLSTRSLGGGVSVVVARGIGFHIGYTATHAYFGPSGSSQQALPSHNIDAGLDFNRPLSLSRRMTATFASGVSAFAYNGQTHYFLTGSAALVREIGRTWTASVNYSRSVNYVEVFRVPVLGDSLGASVGGLITRRLQFSSSVGAARGTVGLGAGANHYTSEYGSTGLTIGLTRLLGLSATYTYYRYGFDAGVVLPAGVSRHTDRQSINLALTFSEPLFRRMRRPNAAR